VLFLQLSLKTLGFYSGAIDGIFGPKTTDAVLTFQAAQDELTVDGVVGTQTWGKIEHSLDVREVVTDRDVNAPADAPGVPYKWEAVPAEIFEHLETICKTVVSRKVGYGPGRGWYEPGSSFEDGNGRFVCTIGPYGLGGADYKTQDSKKGPAFVCSTWTYFASCMLTRVNEGFNAAIAGGVPNIFDVMAKPHRVHPIAGLKYGYYGFEPFFRLVTSRGCTGDRRPSLANQPKEMDLLEIWERRELDLPEIMICSQAFASKGFHSHTAILWIDRKTQTLYRCAADGGKTHGNIFSGTDMDIEIVDYNVAKRSALSSWYRCYGMIPDNLDSVLAKPACELAFEVAPYELETGPG